MPKDQTITETDILGLQKRLKKMGFEKLEKTNDIWYLYLDSERYNAGYDLLRVESFLNGWSACVARFKQKFFQ